MLSETKRIGTIGELAVQQDLMRRGWDVYTSVGDCTKIDILAIKDGKVIRLQVKTVTDSSSGKACFSASKVISRKPVWYEANDFDYLAVHVIDRNKVAYIPMSVIFRRCLTLRFEPARNGQTKDTHFFSKYENLVIV